MVFRIDLKIFIFLILLYLTKQIEIYSIIMIFAMIHECSHLLAGLLLKMKIKRITLMPLGFTAELKLTEEDYNKKILKSNKLEIKRLIIAMAGPFSNFFIVYIIKLFNIDINLMQKIIYSNIMIGLFNLIPIYPLDGGRILKALLSLLYNKRKATIYINKISNIMLFIITFILSILIYYFQNIALLFIIIYLSYIVFKENRIYKMKIKLYYLD